MGRVKGNIEILGLKKTIRTEAIFDTGSAYTILSRDLFKQLELPFFEGKTFDVELADKRPMKLQAALAYMRLDGCEKPVAVGIMDDPAYPLIVGFLQMEAMGVKIDPTTKSFTYECK